MPPSRLHFKEWPTPRRVGSTKLSKSVQRAAQLDNSLTILALQAHVLAVAGRTQEARQLIEHVQDAATHQYFCPYEIATVYVSLGDLDTAHRLFRKGTDEHADCMAWLGVEPWIEAFRSYFAGRRPRA